MSCYSFEKLDPAKARPVLPNVAATYVLTMLDSTRQLDKERLCRLTPHTYIQYNKGFKKCKKPGVHDTGQDIIHAYQNLASHILSETTFEAVLILEDDAIITEDCFKYLTDVDRFIAEHAFDVYSLCSTGFMLPYNMKHRLIMGTLGSANAIIWSRTGLEKLSSVDLKQRRHVDRDIISEFDLKYTYWRPLIMQTFPLTENSRNWSPAARAARHGAAAFLNWHRKPQPGWNIAYMCCGPVFWLTSTCLLTQAFRKARH